MRWPGVCFRVKLKKSVQFNLKSIIFCVSLNGDEGIEISYSLKDDDRRSFFGKSTFQFNVSFVVSKTITSVCSKGKVSLLRDGKFNFFYL